LETKKNFYNDFPPARMLLRACCWVAALGFSDAEGNFSIIFYKNKAPPGNSSPQAAGGPLGTKPSRA